MFTTSLVIILIALTKVTDASIYTSFNRKNIGLISSNLSYRKERDSSSINLDHKFIESRRLLTFRRYTNLRGGDDSNNNKTNSSNEVSKEDRNKKNDDNDEERYSRQLYTLGARAHSLVRLSTIIIDGPTASGLLYEAVKNLALSGVGKIIILTNDGDDNGQGDKICNSSLTSINVKKEHKYFNSEMDDLGIMYKRGARAECFPRDVDMQEVDDLSLILEYIRRLNPSVNVQTETRNEFINSLKSGTNKDNVGDNNDQDTEKRNELLNLVGGNPIFLSVDRPQSSQIVLNDVCRQGGIPFVSIETAGCYGRVFCDFGDIFHVVDEDGETPQATLLQKLELSPKKDIKKDGEFTVHCVDGEHHDVSKGDIIEFKCKNDNEGALEKLQCMVVFVKNPVCFTAKLCSQNEEGLNKEEATRVTDFIKVINDSANSFSRVKQPKQLSFMSLSEALKRANDPKKGDIFAASDLDKSFDITRRSAIMSSFDALDKFVEDQNRLPNPLSEENANDRSIFLDITKLPSDKSMNSFISSFVLGCKAKFVPLQAIFGALGAQEVLKAASGLYNPITQFLLYDCDEVLERIKEKDRKNISSNSKAQAKGMKYILGKKLVRKLASEKIFVVGSGAIGCELLKNLAAMDVATQKKKGGSIILTDMDTIEKSNLSRQFLFRDADVGKFKSAAAEEAVQRLNPRVQMDTHTSKVGEDSTSKETSFNDKFWSDGVNIVLNALDNVEARLFMDSMCVANRKAMIDAGTLGAKGNVQVVVPCQSESYGSSADPPEPTIAVCTLKNFPYQISHTIQWGRDLFDGLFSRRPSQVNEYSPIVSTTSTNDMSKALLQKLGEDAAIEVAAELAEDLIVFKPNKNYGNVRESSIQWAVSLSRKFFYSSINKLLRQHPLDSLDEDGEPFWSGTRRAPSPLLYSDGDDISSEAKKINDNLIDFVRYAARLRIETFLSIKSNPVNFSEITVDEAKSALKNQLLHDDIVDDSGQPLLARLDAKLKKSKLAAQAFSDELNIASFEKDDEENGHVSFVTAASNLRAIAYGIPPVDQMETRRIAGRIVPAMISTTAFVSALSCIELIKLIQKAPLRSYRNAFVNLALPFFAFTAPLPAEQLSGLHGSVHTIWDRIIVKESEKLQEKGGINLKQLIRRIKKAAAPVSSADDLDNVEIEISNISFGPYMLFANFLHEDDETVLNKPVIELIIEAILSDDEDFDVDDDIGDDESGQKSIVDTEKLSESQKSEVQALRRRSFLDLSVIVEDSKTGEEAELPPVRLKFFHA